jgi:hypothetical protein
LPQKVYGSINPADTYQCSLASTFERQFMSVVSPPIGVIAPKARSSSVIKTAMRVVPRDGAWHVVGEPFGGTTAEQYARRLNSALELPGLDSVWEFAYQAKGDFGVLWARWCGDANQSRGAAINV